MIQRTLEVEAALLAMSAARILSQFGVENPTWSEWIELKDALLRLKPHLSKPSAKAVGKACSKFQEAARNNE